MFGVADLFADGAPNAVGVEGFDFAPVFAQQRPEVALEFRVGCGFGGWAFRCVMGDGSLHRVVPLVAVVRFGVDRHIG